MSNRIRLAMVAGAAAVFMAATVMAASAQGGRGGRGFGGGLMLLNVPEVQKELGMTQAQIDKVQPKAQELRESMQNSGFDFQNASPEERQQFQQKMQAAQNKAVAEILDTKQTKRFHQLELQRAGGGALLRPDVAAALKITDDQKAKIQAALEAGRPQPGGFDFQNATPEERQQFFQKMQAAQQAAGEKAMAVLSDSQRAQWKEMTGAPFKFPPMQFGRRGGGGGQRP